MQRPFTSPVDAADPLSAILKSVRLEGAFFLDAEFRAPWCIRGSYGATSALERMGGAEHVLLFHVLTRGACRVRLAGGGDVIDVSAGDVILFPRDDRHVMGSDTHLAPDDADALIAAASAAEADGDSGLTRLRLGGAGASCEFVCGYLACARSMCRPLFEALPRVLRVRLMDAGVAGLLGELLRAGVRESGRVDAGAQSILAKLAELMFVETIRRHVAALPDEAVGLLAALRDPAVGRALAAIHADPARAWTLRSLAKEAAVSRTLLVERFTMLAGEPPMRYLARWRLALAARHLRVDDRAIAVVAEGIGYGTEASFSKAFRREFGMPPGAWRRAARDGTGTRAGNAACA